jgi:predicted RNase H-like nuclease
VNVLGVDLAWGLGRPDGRPPNETGVVALATDGRVTDAGWTVTLDETADWIDAHAEPDCVLFVDAPLLVENERGQRTCETQVGQRYGRWKVAANSSNLGLPHAAGVVLRTRLEERGWRYDDGHDGPSLRGRTMSECYPYTTIVGSPALGYDIARPTYKRKPRAVPTVGWRPMRAAACDGLIAALAALDAHDPPLDLRSHPVTRALVDEPSPELDRAYKHREDLLDAAIAAWSAAVWVRHGFDACQVLGDPRTPSDRPAATIIAPARPEQRRP